MATTSGYVEVGPGKTFTTWAALLANLGDLTGDLYVMQTGHTSEPGSPLNAINLNGYKLTFDNDSPHYGVLGVGNIIRVLSNPGTPIIRLETTGDGIFEVKNLQVDETGLTDAETAFQFIQYFPCTVTLAAHDLLAIGSLLDVAVTGVNGIELISAVGDIDAWNLKAFFWNDVGIAVAPGYFSTGSIRMENCTAYYCANFGIYNLGSFFVGGGVLQNNVAVGCLTSDFYDFNFGGYIGNNNASSDGSAGDGVWSGGGSNNQPGISPIEFKSLNPADPDFLMVASGGVLEGGGAAVLITENVYGIRGNDRPGADGLYSIGADEFGTVTPPVPPTSSSSSSSSTPTPTPTPEFVIVGDAPGANLGRSLLLNRSGAEQPAASFFGQEYVSPSYRQVQLPSGLLSVRRALFGGDPDLAGLNYMVWQYMRLLHSTEFESYVTDIDPRVTYLNNKSLVDYPYGASVSENAEALQFIGTPSLGDNSGRLNERWKVEQLGGAYRITSYRTGFAEVQVPTIDGGVTSFMPMTGHAGFKVRVLLGRATQSSWEVEYMAKPTSAMDPINRAVQVGKIGTEALLELFPLRAPYDLFKQLWEQHSEFAYKMSGVLLALIYRTREIRSGG